MTIPKIGWFAQCTNTEGNMFGMIEMDEKHNSLNNSRNNTNFTT